MKNIQDLYINTIQKYNKKAVQKKYYSPYDSPFNEVISKGLSKHSKEFIQLMRIGVYEGLINQNTIENCKKMSLTTSCMNRNGFLLNSLMTWVLLPFKEIVIVDWTSDTSVERDIGKICGNIIPEEYFEKVRVVRVDGKKYYQHSEVRNVKIDNTKGDWIFCVDSDICLNHLFARYFLLDNENVYYKNTQKVSDKGLFGTSIFSRKMYEDIGKFDEEIQYWGNEDGDFYDRAKEKGYVESDIRSISMYHQEHDDDVRARYTPYESIWKSLTENNYKIAKKRKF